MNIWAVANQKGGVGKTTTVVTLAGLLQQQGKRVLVIDLDPHASLTTYLGFDPANLGRSVFHLFCPDYTDSVESLIVKSETGLSLLPASPALAGLDRRIGQSKGLGLTLQDCLPQLTGKFDHIMIDCPPLLGVPMVNAMAVCEQVIIPVQTEYLALKGLERMIATLSMVGQSLNRSINYVILPTMFDRRTRASKGALKSLQENYPDNLASIIIPIDTRFRDASQAGKPLTVLHPSTHGAQAYREFCLALHTKQSSAKKDLFPKGSRENQTEIVRMT